MLEKIKKDQLQARKNRDTLKATLLTTLYSEAAMIGKNKNRESTEAEVVATIKKFISNIDFSIGHSTDVTKLEEEKKILVGYLPVQLSQEEMNSVALNLIEQHGKNLGLIMKNMKDLNEGKYDGAEFSKIVKSLL